MQEHEEHHGHHGHHEEDWQGEHPGYGHGHHHGRHHGEQCSCGHGEHHGYRHHGGEGRRECRCGCGASEHGFRRRFQTREEQISRLEEYLRELQAEAKAVEELIAELKA